jgi:urease accessory protein UreE
MSSVYNPESDVMAEIERLELEAREIHRRIEQAHKDDDRRVLDRQLKEIQAQIEVLRTRLP